MKRIHVPTLKTARIKEPVLNKSSEHAEQVALIDWCRYNENRYPGLNLIFAVPNGAALSRRRGSTFSLQGMKLKREGMRAGVLDLFLAVGRGNFLGLFVEMKYGKNKLTDEQKAFIKGVKEQGYLTAVCYSADSAIEIIEDYFNGRIIRDQQQ